MGLWDVSGASIRQQQIDRAFDRIEETILPGIGMLLDTLLDAAERRETAITPAVYAAELRTLALQVEALTREIEAVSPSRGSFGDDPGLSAAAG